ncbi:ATP-binding protein [Flavobacterium psychrophilum]|nr:ATP-binding protein [Flavobacterium psychrophilum]EKT4510511.1 ATP-binding protein [Flavobacterium psychrophilum]
MTNVQKNEIVNAIKKEISFSSGKKVSIKCDVSNATISNMINENWDLIKVDLWLKVANKLNITFSGWQVVEITNFKIVTQILNDAKNQSWFMPISHKAGSGKTTAIEAFVAENSNNAVYKIQAKEWAKREFLINLLKVLKKPMPKGVVTTSELGEIIIDFFIKLEFEKPLLIIDEADKLKAPALRFFIEFENALKKKVGVVICGTENLEKEIKNGVRLSSKGYDEIDSRFRRKFQHLIGATAKDVIMICEANGIFDKQLQNEIFKECNPTPIVAQNQSFKVVEDLRRLERIIERELLKINSNTNQDEN